MIAHRIVGKSDRSSSSSKLIKYIIGAKGGSDPVSWQRTADYILDTTSDGVNGEKVKSCRVTNCNTDDPADALFENCDLKNKADRDTLKKAADEFLKMRQQYFL
ncbi:conjugal transfer nickase/helicase TraI [Bartonella australis AUST/NH1]|uniref:Conjugal transfer nickase/helicase TraI n=1 Tax=Bartonella australis (strain Aust/NH1) TaxID=1094489 RepID=M1PBB6_BARAA|nr:hypothetical protein [Bartonella australis]AGF73941.1 conjugal transfer nickase/helicase TraI [Bartonella australis AUST/NH1]